MAIIVVGGSGRGAGKTALICGLVRALPEVQWTAVKVSSHEHDNPKPIYEELNSGEGTDTARYLAAGAKRALLVTADEAALGATVERVLAECPAPACLIFESNSVLEYLRPDLCLVAATGPKVERKDSFGLIEQRMDAMVELAGHDHVIEGEKLAFRLASLERISPVMLAWLKERLGDFATAGAHGGQAG